MFYALPGNRWLRFCWHQIGAANRSISGVGKAGRYWRHNGLLFFHSNETFIALLIFEKSLTTLNIKLADRKTKSFCRFVAFFLKLICFAFINSEKTLFVTPIWRFQCLYLWSGDSYPHVVCGRNGIWFVSILLPLSSTGRNRWLLYIWSRAGVANLCISQHVASY